MHVPCEDKSDDIKDSLYEELGSEFDRFPRYDMNIFFWMISMRKLAGKIEGNKSSHEICKDNGITLVNSATSKNLVVKVKCSLIATLINTPGPLLRERCTRSVMFS
jgi:hypothetical protein